MKVCCKCKKEKTLNEFGKSKSTSDGYLKACKVCRKKEQSLYYTRRKDFVKEQAKQSRTLRRERWREYKATLSCMLCNEDYPKALDHHHVNPEEKSFELSKECSNRSWDVLMEEADKCVVLCKNCHVKVHDGVLEINRSLV